MATATAGAFTAVVAALSVTAAPLLTQTAAAANEPAVAAQAFGATERFRPRAARQTPLVIAHRGASAYVAEHTLEAYRLAVQLKADYIEADLVVTADGELVARHEPQLSLTTDVVAHPEFADRRRTKQVDGVTVTDWFTEDFTLPELRTLRATTRGTRAGTPQPVATVPTLQEIIDLARVESASRNRPVGLYLELKSPGYFRAAGLPLERRLASIVKRNGLDAGNPAVFVESFESDSLKELHTLVDVPLIQLVWGGTQTGQDPLTRPEWLSRTRDYASGIGVDRERLATVSRRPSPSSSAPAAGASGGPAEAAAPDGAERVEGVGGAPVAPAAPTWVATTSGLVAAAHRFGLEVHVFTFAGTATDYRPFYALGVDGVFTDNPDIAVAAR